MFFLDSEEHKLYGADGIEIRTVFGDVIEQAEGLTSTRANALIKKSAKELLRSAWKVVNGFPVVALTVGKKLARVKSSDPGEGRCLPFQLQEVRFD